MAKQIYKSTYISLIDGTEIYITPLKIKFLRQFMEKFDKLKTVKGEEESLDLLLECIAISMKQYYPILKTKEDVEDSIDMETMYEILDIGAGIKLKKDSEDPDPIEKKASNSENSSWEDLDLVALESEVFLIGIWKDYEELESSLCMEELTEILNAKREADYNEKKFLAAMQGVDLDEQSGKKEEDPWEAMKARVFSKGSTDDPNDILALRGPAAARAGFGIGNGLSYEKWD